jgi:hypothetical protein
MVVQFHAFLSSTLNGRHQPSIVTYKKVKVNGKAKAVPLQAWSGPEGFRKLRFPDFITTAQDGGKVSLPHRPPLPPGNNKVLISVKD